MGAHPAPEPPMTALDHKRCIPCEGGVERLPPASVAALLPEVPAWNTRGEAIARVFLFPDFVDLMRFVQRLADLAEAEGHHPDFCVHWNKLDVSLWTHAIGGLHENDFVLARKIDLLHEAHAAGRA